MTIEDFPMALAGLLTPPPTPQPMRGAITDVDRRRAYERCLAYLATVDPAVSGSGGHDATFYAACTLYRFGLSESEAWDALTWFNANKCQPPWSESDLRHKLNDAHTKVLADGEFGAKLLEREIHADEGEIFIPEPEPANTAAQQGTTPTPVAAEPTTDRPDKPPVIKDSQLRDLYLQRHRTTVFGLGDWYRYERGVYVRTPESVIAKEIQTVIDEQEREDQRLRPTFWLRKGVMGMVQDAVAVPDERWNRNPDILVCRNGTLIISQHELRKHSPDDFVTSGVNYDFDPTVTAPTWQRYLDEVLPHARDFLQEFVGLSLTTITDYEIAVWLYGPPGGGKSTFINGIKAMLSDRHGVLGLSDIERSPFMLYSLIGRTLVTATENPNDFPIALGKVNQIISGEPITVDLKHKTPIELRPAAKLLWAMNDLPRVTDANNGIFRRVKVVHVNAIAPERVDVNIKKAIEAEAAGILNWALVGLARLQARGRFEVPAEVVTETAAFKASNDTEQAFVLDACNTFPSARVRASVFYEAYREWCKANGHGLKSSTRAADEWRRLGFSKEHKRDGAYWVGVELKPVDIFMG